MEQVNLSHEAVTFAELALCLLGASWQQSRVRLEPLTPDGSLRRFCRLVREDGARAVAICPPGDNAGLREAAAGWQIGCHLFACGAPVPELLGFDTASGLLVCEDLGNIRLHELVLKHHGLAAAELAALYRQTVTELAKMQVQGRNSFDPAWCWDTPRYDRQLMLERESGYFLRALCRDLLRLELDEAALAQEFSALADKAAQADASFFLHRDFQSRNIMVQHGRVRFIDYQAGRFGPLAYDLASLLIDPYAALPLSLQDELLEQYLDTLTALIPYSREQFRQEYLLLAVQRNLQILGAFAFLSSQRGRPFFAQYLRPALHSLRSLLAAFPLTEYVCLQDATEQCLRSISRC